MTNSLGGYHGQYLKIDLTKQTTTKETIPPEVLRNFIGGTGLGTWLLLKESPAELDPLSSEAPLAFIFSPLVGGPVTTSAKFAVMAKSPLTHRINDSLASSHFAILGKKTGYDALLIVGACETPHSLVIHPDKVDWLDANHLWGKSIPEADELLKSELGSQYEHALIGPAGEQLVRFATISHDQRHAGRGGLGAVMGSKKLKAIAVWGDQRHTYAYPEKLITLSKQLSQKSLGPATIKYRELGTVSNLLTFNRLGTLPTQNFQQGSLENLQDLRSPELTETISQTRKSCAACTIGCEHIFHTKKLKQGVRLEYESLFSLGSLCGISDQQTVIEATQFCNEMGLDTISAGVTIAFAMECAERGLINEPELRFGNPVALTQLLESIAHNVGLGKLLSQGTRAAAKQIGQGAEEFAAHVKGLEIPGYDPRALQTMALGFAVNPRGADHNRSGAYQVDFSEKVNRLQLDATAIPYAIQTENQAALMDSLILCKFLRGIFSNPLKEMAEILQLTVGWEVTPNELEQTADRIITAKKWYNIQQGWTPQEDTLPQRFFSQPLNEELSPNAILDPTHFQELIQTYNLARGFTATGWIDPQRLTELKAQTHL